MPPTKAVAHGKVHLCRVARGLISPALAQRPTGAVGDARPASSGGNPLEARLALLACTTSGQHGVALPAVSLAAPLAADSLAGPSAAKASSAGGVPAWQFRDLWLASEAQPLGGVSPADDLSSRLDSMALHSPGGLPAGYLDNSTGFSPSGSHTLPYTTPSPRRVPMDINHNKAITKKLASAVHYQQVCLQCLAVCDSMRTCCTLNIPTDLHSVLLMVWPGT